MSYDVIVIGAGAAGLIASTLLHKEKLRVKLLEGSALLGG
jgi:phytoene dehydrogenase-like protein